MIVNTIYFVLGILVPYAVEQYAYSKLIPVEKKPGGEVLQGYGWRLVWDAAYFFVFVGAVFRIIFTDPSLRGWEWLGYSSFLLGVLLRIWALRELGRFYDPGIMVKADHQVIQTGPYHILRHPLHLGTLMQIIGLSAFSPVWLALPAALASLTLCLYLNYTEDRFHARQLDSAFRPYYLQTWDIVDLIFWKSKLK